MAHTHLIYDTGKRFIINPATKTIDIPKSNIPTLSQYDHNSEYITFEMARFVEGHDLSLCDKVEIHYNNIEDDEKRPRVSRGFYEAQDLRVDPNDESKVVFTWIISKNATTYKGLVYFVISFVCLEDEEVRYRWNTIGNSYFPVSTGINNTDYIEEKYADLLELWRAELFGLSGDEAINIQVMAQKQMKAIEQKGAETLATIPEEYAFLQSNVDKFEARLDLINNGYEVAKGEFVIGGLINGELTTQHIYRTSSSEPISYDRDITINVKDGYRYAVHFFENEVFASDSGWKTESMIVPADSYFKLQIEKIDAGWVEADIPEYLLNVPITSNISNRFDANDDYISNLYASVDNSNNGLETIKGEFRIGGLLYGEPVEDQIYRICSVEPISYDHDITITVDEGYTFGVHIFVDGAFSTATDWLSAGTQYSIPANTEFKLAVSCDPVVWVEADITTYIRAVKVSTLISTEITNLQRDSVKKSLFSPKIPRFLMHRGKSYTAPENTVAAFREAGLAGAFGIETDIYITSDGHYMCSHDDDISAYTNAPSGTTITGNTMETVRSYMITKGSGVDVYSTEKIPTLEEYLEVCLLYGCVPFIEIKNINNTFTELAALVNSYGFYENAAYINYKVYYQAIRKAVGNSIIMINLEGDATTYDAQIEALHDMGAYNIAIAMAITTGDITKDMIKKCHEYGFLTGVWTANEIVDAEKYIRMGVDIVTSDVLAKFSNTSV